MRRVANPAAIPHERHGTLPVPVAAVVRAVPRADATVAPMTFILPDLPWAVLLRPIVRDARPGDSVVVHTDAMRVHVEHFVRAAGRDDLLVRQVAPPPPRVRT